MQANAFDTMLNTPSLLHTFCSHFGMAEGASCGRCRARDATAKLPDANAPLYTSALEIAMMSADMRYCARSVTTACIAATWLTNQGCRQRLVQPFECRREADQGRLG